MIPKIIRTVLPAIPFLFINNVPAQVAAVSFTVTVPGISKQDKGVYIAGSFNYWHAGDSLYRMTKVSEGLYTITLPLFDGVQYKYKYTSGSWDKVEIASNDSDINNRSFFSMNGKAIRDTVIKWKQPKVVEKTVNPQMQKIMAMKDSTLAKIQPGLNDMQQILRSYVENLLQEKPSKRVHKRLDKKASRKIGDAYKQITGLLWNVFASLTPEQKQKLLDVVKQSEGKTDFINPFLKILGEVIEGNKPA